MEVPTAEVIDLTISPPQRWEAAMSGDRTTVQQGTMLGLPLKIKTLFFPRHLLSHLLNLLDLALKSFLMADGFSRWFL